jgi:isopenicillin-N epimerase
MNRDQWLLDQEIIQLNHGSFGATPRPVLEEQDRWRRRFEANPTGFVIEEMEPALDEARRRLAGLIGSDPTDLVFVVNATMGVNTVVRSLHLEPGDQLLTTNHTYNACRNVLNFAVARAGAEVVVAAVPFPLDSPTQVVDAILGAATDRTRFALFDHITSSTGLVFPIEEVIPSLEQRGIRVMIDGAHGPGMVPIDLSRLGCSYYTGNCHKWLCSPKGSGFLWARPELATRLVPPVISHGWNDTRQDRPRFHLLFDYMGADDPSPHLAVPAAIDFLDSLDPEGLVGLMQRNRQLALEGRQMLCDFFGVPAPAPDSMIGSLATVPMPAASGEPVPGFLDPLGRTLLAKHRIQIPVFLWPAWPKRHIRISAMAYNSIDDVEELIEALKAEL